MKPDDRMGPECRFMASRRFGTMAMVALRPKLRCAPDAGQGTQGSGRGEHGSQVTDSAGHCVRTQDSVVILTADGALDSSSSALLRDSLTRATLEQPSAVIVNVTELQVAEESAWSVFISARWQADFRADVPVLLVCGHRAGRAAVTRTGVARFMPVYPTEKAASKAIGRLARRNFKRSDAQLPANLNSLRESRQLVREWLTQWSRPGLFQSRWSSSTYSWRTC